MTPDSGPHSLEHMLEAFKGYSPHVDTAILEKAYRFWYFDNKGAFPRGQSLGRWNPKTRTLTFKTDFGNGVSGTFLWKFPTADRFEWSLQARDRNGTLVLDMSGVATRKKK